MNTINNYNPMRKRISILRIMTILLLFGIISCQEQFEYEYSEQPTPVLGVDMVTYFNNNPGKYSQLSEAITRAGLTEMLRTETITFFAPENRAFDRYFNSNKNYNSVEDIPVEELKNILLHHMLPGKYLVFDFTEEQKQYTPFYGNDLTINYQNSPMNNRLYRIFVNKIQVKISNMEPTNGAIHVIFDGLIK
jgi:uncharacterized surface protein with fasciclin (FAS1) repeats